MVCAISSDDRHFEILDEIILEVGRPKWAPSKDILAYIAGGGRLVFGFKEKDLITKEFPIYNLYTGELRRLGFCLEGRRYDLRLSG